MSFNEGFSTQGIPYITGSDGQVLTWDAARQEWVAGEGIGSVVTSVSTSNGIIGDGTSGNEVRLDNNITVQNLTVTQTASIAHLDTIYQQSLVIGDKYITLLSGSSTHAQMNGAGLLWGSGSTDGTTGDMGSVAYVLYRDATTNHLEVFPGLKVSGSLTASQGISSSAGFYGDASGLTNLPTQADYIIYVSSGSTSSTQNGSLTDPFKTIQGALNYASSNYSDFSKGVIVEVAPGKYTENLSITRHNTYIRSHLNKVDQRAIEIAGSASIDFASATQKYNHVVGFEGLLFNSAGTDPVVTLQGNGSGSVYLKNSYFASYGGILRTTSTRNFSNTKIIARNVKFNSQRAGVDALKFQGGDINLDTVEMYCSSSIAGVTNAISASGDVYLAADRMLIEMSGRVTGSAIINESTTGPAYPSPEYFYPTMYLTDCSFNMKNAAAVNSAAINTTRNVFLWNTLILSGFRKINGSGVGAIATYGDITSDSTVSFSGVTQSYLTEYHGNIVANAITASSGVSGSLYGTATNADKLGGLAAVEYALLNKGPTTQNWWGTQRFVNLAGTPSNIRIAAGGYLQMEGGDVYVTGNVKVVSGYFSGSGTQLTNLSASNWGPTNSFATDVRNQLSGGTGISYNSSTGLISASPFTGVVTGSNLTGSGKDSLDPIKLVDNVSTVSVTASAGFSGRLYNTASYAINAGNSLTANTASRLDTYSSGDFAKLATNNSFTGNQNITGYVSASAGLTGSLYGGNVNAVSVSASAGLTGSLLGGTINASSISASSGITGSFSGTGAGISGLTGSNWNNGTSGFISDVRNQLVGGTGINYNPADGIINWTGADGGGGLLSSGSITGSGKTGNEFRLKDDIQVRSVTGSFNGSISGSNATFNTSSNDFLYSKKAVIGPSGSFDSYQNNFGNTTIPLIVGDYYNTGSATQFGVGKEKIIVGGVSGSFVAATEFGQTGSTLRTYMGLALGQAYFGVSSNTGGKARLNIGHNGGGALTIEANNVFTSIVPMIMGVTASEIISGGSYTTGPFATYPARLHITSSNGDGAAVFAASSSTQPTLRLSQYGTSDTFIVEDETRPDTTPFVIKNDGKVGVGTTTPSAKLEVIGNISASAGITGSFSGSYYGNGSNLTNLTGAASSFPNFDTDVRARLSGTYPIIYNTSSGEISFGGIADLIYTAGNITGSGTSGNPIGIKPNSIFDTITASVGFSGSGANITNVDALTLGGLTSQKYAKTGSNIFNGDQQITGNVLVSGYISASAGLTGSFSGSYYGDGSQLTNLTGAASSFPNFITDVRNQISGTSPIIYDNLTGEISLGAIPNAVFDTVTASIGFSGSGANITNVDALTLGGLGSQDYATTASNIFNGNQTITGNIETSGYVSSSTGFYGNGLNLTNLSGSQFTTWSNDVRNVFIAGSGISISASNGQYVITSSGGTGGGGLSTVNTSGSITGSGEVGNEVRLKNAIQITTVTSSYYTGSWAQISTITASSINAANIETNHISASVLTASHGYVNYIDFNRTPPADATVYNPGRIRYSANTGDLLYDVDVSPFNINLGQQTVLKVKNGGGTTLNKGQVVRIGGAVGNNPLAVTASWGNDATSADTLGLVMGTIAVNEFGYVILEGVLSGVNTNGYSEGSMFYLSSSGNYTNTKPPTPYHEVRLGQVLRANTANGSVFVKIQNGYELDELHDVTAPTPANGDLLVYNTNAQNQWINAKTLSGSYTVLGELTASDLRTSGNIYTNVVYGVVTNALTCSVLVGLTRDNVAFKTEDNTFVSGNIFQKVTQFQSAITGTSALFTGDVTIQGTASIGKLTTVAQDSIVVGTKYITIMSGASTHVDLNGAGILFGSGSTDPTTGVQNSVASIIYNKGNAPTNYFSDYIEIFPGLRVSGSLTSSGDAYFLGSVSASVGLTGSFSGSGAAISGISINNITNFTSSVRALFTGSSGITITNGTASLEQSISISSLTASAGIIGDGSSLTNVSAQNSIFILTSPLTSSLIGLNNIVAFSGSYLCNADKTDDRKSNAIGIVTKISGTTYTITTGGEVTVNGAEAVPLIGQGGKLVYVGTTGACTDYDSIGSGENITQIGIKSINSGKVLLQPRIFGVKS